MPTELELKVKATVTHETLSFRMAGAKAELADGRSIEVAQPISNNGILVIISDADKKWRTYFLSAEALATAVLEYEVTLAEQNMLMLQQLAEAMNLYTPAPGECICWKCLAGKNYAGMVLCPTCGNKRCPKASDHELACTNSNEPGQPGSVYNANVLGDNLGAPDGKELERIKEWVDGAAKDEDQGPG